MLFKFTTISALLIALTTLPAQAENKKRWVSLNQCVDIALARWSERGELVGITKLHKDNELSGIERHNGTLESILSLRPTTVFATEFNQRRLIEALKDYVDVVVLPQPRSWEVYEQWLSIMSAQTGYSEKADQHKTKLQIALESQADSRSAIVIMPNQYSWGEGSWTDSMFSQMGWQNLASTAGYDLVSIDLEQLISWQPDTVIMEGFADDAKSADFALANIWRHHPVVRRWMEEQDKVHFIPHETSSCPVVNAAEYVEALGHGRGNRE
ncbi:ABC transporter substrate-binding protein [Idiomarina piscisalsi]|uniref:ABC transporter substrate-binding protein n=1 Tax=Idiomarina piscisalsi TaxID=1096243 RepID=UPI00138509D6|nr:ABC transporter substrate-binding protein [Idiomarina piscisalsi]MTJ02403.1 ABC transporter substrate-binding protein [Idiomarina piscisalsi]